MGNITNAERARRKQVREQLAALAIIGFLLVCLFSFARKHPLVAIPLYAIIAFFIWQFVKQNGG